MTKARWQFWIDRGGTFTDIVARSPDGTVMLHKLLSENPAVYVDAALQGIRDVLQVPTDQPIPADQIDVVKMGTTVATNALLERKGDRTLLAITKGFKDALRIGYQNRPQIFAQQIILPEMLYERVIEVDERLSAQGEELIPVDLGATRAGLQAAYDDGIRSCAIVLMHGYRYPDHEDQVAALARSIGFEQISISHCVSPLIKLVSRGDTTVVDAYLSPILRRYVDRVVQALGNTRLMFMQSNGGLVDSHYFQGKDSILSGPAGGVVGAVQTSAIAGFDKIIGFDMGGTSTDVCHFNGTYERVLETELTGVRLRTPMMAIHTVAAGGGSILTFDGARFRVGPESAGANPGPACYRQGGPLTVTDCNVMLGKIQPNCFPQVFGPDRSLPLDSSIVHQKFTNLATEICKSTGQAQTPEQVAQGFLAIAVENMANAIKKISLQRGHDVSEYTLCCFGSAGGQHACLIAEVLGIQQVLIHPYAGVLSAYGMGLADLRVNRQQTVEIPLTSDCPTHLAPIVAKLTTEATTELQQQDIPAPDIQIETKAYLRYTGTDSPLPVDLSEATTMQAQFEQGHRQRYGFIIPERSLMVESLSIEAIGKAAILDEPEIPRHQTTGPTAIATVTVYTHDQWHPTPIYQRHDLQPGDRISGPALIIEPTGTNMIEPAWQVEVTARRHLILNSKLRIARSSAGLIPNSELRIPNSEFLPPNSPSPVLLEIFNNLFMAIAEQMGVTLQNTSYSVNIKERLDFSCAIFDAQGELVANAPHIPVHLGSMGESVQAVIAERSQEMQPGDVYVLNDPYNGGTHLPDITVITPVFASTVETQARENSPSTPPVFYVASRGHHADIGGITPGSMPAQSQTVEEEGVLIHTFLLVKQGQLQEEDLLNILTSGSYPARNPQQNLADLQAQIAANQCGVQELHRMVTHYGLATVRAYMGHVQVNAEQSVRRVIDRLQDGQFTHVMDGNRQIQVQITVDRQQRSARIDFQGSCGQQPDNFNAPLAITKAAVLYVFRTLVAEDIPLNAGCLKPLEIVIPPGSILHPSYPAAVVAGNVETSQAIVNALYGALGCLAAAQGTMNNFTFGNERYQYYETICGGSGAGPTFDGTDAVHTHMTNSRLTDPEVLEWRFPVILENFAIRSGSGGLGQYKGGNGVVRRLRFLEPMTAAILSSHRQVPPFGLGGGQPGQVGSNRVERQDSALEELGGKATIEIQAGDAIIIATPGGGGFGPYGFSS